MKYFIFAISIFLTTACDLTVQVVHEQSNAPVAEPTPIPTVIPPGEYSYGQLPCDGSLGNFDVYLIKAQTTPVTYQLAIIPVTLDAPGDIISVTITNSSLAYRTLIDQVVVNLSQEIDAGPLTDADLQTYDVLALTLYQAGVPFSGQQSGKDAVCYMPQLGDGISGH